MMCNEQFMRKSLEEPLDFFDELAENNQSWDFWYCTNNTRHEPNQNTSRYGKYKVRKQDDLQTKYAQLARKLESLELKKNHEVSTSSCSEEICVICDRQGHSAAGCPRLSVFKEVLQNGEQISVNAFN